MKKNVVLDGMSCNHCVMRVTKVLEQAGISTIDVSINYAIVDTDIDNSKIKELIEDVGYIVKEIN